ncbi:MAG: hypothetical protein D6752_02270, partial [Candidatus Nitrosothermus koennekii]
MIKYGMENITEDEKIISTLYSVASHSGGFFSRNRECILCLTNRRIAVIYKTDMKASRWQNDLDKQKDAFKKGEISTIRKASYTIEDLNTDLDYEENLNIPFDNIIEIKSEKKRWGPELKIVFKEKKKHAKSLNFALVKNWIRYPLPDPIEYEKPDWEPFINAVKS